MSVDLGQESESGREAGVCMGGVGQETGPGSGIWVKNQGLDGDLGQESGSGCRIG